MKRALALAILSGLIPVFADAQIYRAIGPGLLPCSNWTAAHQPNASDNPMGYLYENWVLGFLSGIGYVHRDGDDPLNGLEADGVFSWVSGYCQGHPTDHISIAAVAFYLAHPR